MQFTGNQYDNYQGHVRAVEAYMNRPIIRSAVDGYVELIRSAPEACIIPEATEFKMRHGGANPRTRVRTRVLVYHAMGYDIPPYGFGVSTCGTPRCVNPEHQQPLFERPCVGAVQFTPASALGV